MKNTSNMKTLAEIQSIFSSGYAYIPLLQRDYKWPKECAAELAEDLWTAFRENKKNYQLNMITVFKDESDENITMQILDGQQRLITLKLLLCILDTSKKYLDFDFERDYGINERSGRRYFLNYILPNIDKNTVENSLSVDTLRLLENYNVMIIPMSFRTVYTCYCECLDKGKDKSDSELENIFTEKLEEIVSKCLGKYFGENKETFKEKLKFQENEKKEIFEACKEFLARMNGKLSDQESDDDISNDEIRISEISEKFQKLWIKKINDLRNENKFWLEKPYDDVKGFLSFILNHVEFLYHETVSEPIEEFQNINENKTRFVISDYIRANMISDNPVDGNITDEKRQENKKNRKEILKLFASISEYLYADEYKIMWKLIKTKYRDFENENYTDINRMKVVFCDKYFGTSTRGYKFSEELERLRYFNNILGALKNELGLGETVTEITWNTYNAVYMLLQCKKKYRFFNLFTENDIKQKKSVRDVVAKDRFCFFEEAYLKSKTSEDIWDISYFLESQLYDEECKVIKGDNLPKIKREDIGKQSQNSWFFINRGSENDKLHKSIGALIQKIKDEGKDI